MDPIDILVRESDRFAEESRNSLRLGAPLLGAAVAVNGLALEASPLALLLTTLAFGVVIVYLNQVFTDVLMIGGYRRHLEEEINAHFERNLLSWERKVMPLRHRNHSPRIIGVAAVGLWLGLSVVAQMQTWGEVALYLSLGHLVLFLLLIAALITSLQEHDRLRRLSYEVAREDARQAPSSLDIVVVHWRIKPGPKDSQRFLDDWSRKFRLEKRSNLVAEFLSEPLTKREVNFDCKIFEHSDQYTSFFNVAIWKDAAAFKSDVYDQIAKDRRLEDYEYDYPERMVLRTLNWRRGNLQFPKRDSLR